MDIDKALEYIHSICWKGSIPGLERTYELLERLGNPQDRLKFVHIAGTNGKGSTASMLAGIFKSAGYRTGLYTSPYILCFHERMQVNGEMITDHELAEITEQVKPHAEAMVDHPTEFELVTAIAMIYFLQKKCDIVILEVGMGGQWDSTNVIQTPEAAVLCKIGLGHVQVLGSTLQEIAETKAGIIKGGDVIVYRTEVEHVFAEKCAQTGAQLHLADFDSIKLQHADFSGQCFDHGERKALFLPLLGEHQRRNAAVVLKTVDVLRHKGWILPEQAVREGLQKTCWAGRFELVSRDPVFFVDGGHNVQCMQALVRNIQDHLPECPITALTGVMADKDVSQMYQIVAPYVSRWVTVTPDNPRAMEAEELAQELRQFGKPVTACQSVEEGVKTAISQTSASGAVVAFGSLYMVGAIRSAVKNRNK